MRHKLFLLAAAIFLAFAANAQDSANAPITIKQTGKKTYSGGLTLTKYNFFLPAYDDTVRSLLRPESECTIWYPSDESKVAHAIASYLGTMILCDGMTPSRISHFKQAFIDLLDCCYDAMREGLQHSAPFTQTNPLSLWRTIIHIFPLSMHRMKMIWQLSSSQQVKS